MKKILILLIVLGAQACDFKKVSKVDILNENNYPISITIQANNISQTYSDIKPQERKSYSYDWTQLNQEEGQFVFWVKNDLTGVKDSFSHGFIRHGELYNFIYLDAKGSHLKVEISN